MSTVSAFKTGIDQRDRFLGEGRCIVCGASTWDVLEHCHIIPQSEPHTWRDLKRRNWIPQGAKASPDHDPRDGLLMCPTHHSAFDKHKFFIRFLPSSRRFVFINYSGLRDYRQFHGKALPLEPDHRHAPFPSIFIIHEMRVRGFYPFEPTSMSIPEDIPWQDWVLSDNVLDETSGSFRHEPDQQSGSPNTSGARGLQFQPMTTSAGGASSGTQLVELNARVIEDILAATRASASWKACEEENRIWKGTAEENIRKYTSMQKIA